MWEKMLAILSVCGEYGEVSLVSFEKDLSPKAQNEISRIRRKRLMRISVLGEKTANYLNLNLSRRVFGPNKKKWVSRCCSFKKGTRIEEKAASQVKGLGS
jgi:hypothetical protein